mmetsp:Transcript_15287/g.32646  ORF Transcript_15287/g.32646 Transcript_15287/m.32646 type:complete len:208 (+) Transcript_15287:518-1141(+)
MHHQDWRQRRLRAQEVDEHALRTNAVQHRGPLVTRRDANLLCEGVHLCGPRRLKPRAVEADLADDACRRRAEQRLEARRPRWALRVHEPRVHAHASKDRHLALRALLRDLKRLRSCVRIAARVRRHALPLVLAGAHHTDGAKAARAQRLQPVGRVAVRVEECGQKTCILSRRYFHRRRLCLNTHPISLRCLVLRCASTGRGCARSSG